MKLLAYAQLADLLDGYTRDHRGRRKRFTARTWAGRTTLVHHLVVSGGGRVVHEGIHGVRDWEPGKVQFKNKRGEDMEWEEIGEKPAGQARHKVVRTRRWKRVKKR